MTSYLSQVSVGGAAIKCYVKKSKPIFVAELAPIRASKGILQFLGFGCKSWTLKGTLNTTAIKTSLEKIYGVAEVVTFIDPSSVSFSVFIVDLEINELRIGGTYPFRMVLKET